MSDNSQASRRPRRTPQGTAARRLPQPSDRPPYRLLADVLRQQIITGQLGPGDQVPPSRVLEEDYGIANMTARAAVRVLLMALLESDHPLLGGDPTPAQWISPPIRHLTCGRAPQGRGRPIASQVQGRDGLSRVGEAQRVAPPKAPLTGRHGPHTSRAGGPGRQRARRSLKLPTPLKAGPSGATSSPGRFQRFSSLRDEGLVHTVHGLGTFVTNPLPEARAATASAGRTHMPTEEYAELLRRIDQLTDVQDALLRLFGQAARLADQSAVQGTAPAASPVPRRPSAAASR